MHIRPVLDQFRERLASVEAAPQLALLGLLAGLVTGIVVLLFRASVEGVLAAINGSHAEAFENLEPLGRLLLPIIGATVIGLYLWRQSASERRLGIPHVLERFAHHQGYFSVKSLINQFNIGVMTLGSGFSVGREGPAVHLGAAASSLIGQWMRLPNNSMRTLVGCGAAAAIAASFNTPLAGVIFAIEIILLDFSLASLLPLTLAAVTGALLSQLVYGSTSVINVPPLALGSLWEVPWLIVCGIVLGALGALFSWWLLACQRWQRGPLFIRLLGIGVLTGAIGWYLPEAMGMGYDSLNAALIGQLSLGVLLSLALIKTLLTATSIGFGLPAGLISPILVCGACMGGALGLIGQDLFGLRSPSGLYAMLGMAAAMGAILQAPLAALIALLELTHNPHIVFPGMLVVAIANLTAAQVLGQGSVFLQSLRQQGIGIRFSPQVQAMQAVGVSTLMERDFICLPRVVTVEHAKRLFAQRTPRWIIIERDDKPITLLRAADLASQLASDNSTDIDLLTMPGERRDLCVLPMQATVHEALAELQSQNSEVLCLMVRRRRSAPRPAGLVTREALDHYYQLNR
nr:chloride channel protein [Atopomonas sediminilitoris]